MRLSSSNSRGMEHPCTGKDLVAEMIREFSRRAKIDLMPEDRGKFVLHMSQIKEVRRTARMELDENNNIALRREVFAENAAKERQLREVVVMAEARDSVQRDVVTSQNHES